MDDEQRVRDPVERTAVTGAFAGGGTLFTEPVLVVNQKTKIIELSNEYSVFDADGNQLGVVRQTGQTTLKKAFRLVSSLDQFLTHTLEIADVSGAVHLRLTEPFRSLVVASALCVDTALKQDKRGFD